MLQIKLKITVATFIIIFGISIVKLGPDTVSLEGKN